MDYKVKIGREIYSIAAGPLDAAGCATVTIGETSQYMSVKEVSSNHLHLDVNGRPMNLFLAPTSEGAWVWVEGRARFVQDAEKAARRKAKSPMETPGMVTPPTPASVVRIMVEVGQNVRKGQPLIVVSAMKMEMTLSAPYSGVVAAVNAQVGAQVRPGEILVEIEAEPEGTDHE